MTANTDDRVLTQKELATRWNLTPRTLQNWFNAGKGPKRVTIGQMVGYRLSDVLQYEEAHTQEPGERDGPKKEFSTAFYEALKASKNKTNTKP